MLEQIEGFPSYSVSSVSGAEQVVNTTRTVFEQSFELAHVAPRRFQAPHICLRRSRHQVNDMEVHRLFFRHLPCFGRYSQYAHR